MPQVPEVASKPKLVNRGGAGLLKQLPKSDATERVQQPLVPDAPVNKINASLSSLIVSIDTLTPDPNNARVHNDRNMEAIRQSLQMYGQVKPVVVRADKRIVVAGNGTIEAAIQLGWTKIAATIVDMDDIEAAGYGLADNRSAELAKWDFEVVARLDKLLLEAQHPSIGWSLDELEVLRAADWTPPAIEDGSNFGEGGSEDTHLLCSFTPDQHEPVAKAVQVVRDVLGGELDQAECLSHICRDWWEMKHASGS